MENLTKEKFQIFMMLCASGIDGNISYSELERIIMQFDERPIVKCSMSSRSWQVPLGSVSSKSIRTNS